MAIFNAELVTSYGRLLKARDKTCENGVEKRRPKDVEITHERRRRTLDVFLTSKSGRNR